MARQPPRWEGTRRTRVADSTIGRFDDLLEPRTDLEPVLSRDRDVALIEEPMQVGPKQKAIADVVRARAAYGWMLIPARRRIVCPY